MIFGAPHGIQIKKDVDTKKTYVLQPDSTILHVNTVVAGVYGPLSNTTLALVDITYTPAQQHGW